MTPSQIPAPKLQIQAIALGLLVAAAINGCAPADAPAPTPTAENTANPDFTGNWAGETGELRVLFYADGELAWMDNRGEQSGSWEKTGSDTLSLTIGQTTQTAKWARNGQILTLTLVESDRTYQLKSDG